MYTTHDLSGGPDDSVDWSARFFQVMERLLIKKIAIQHYSCKERLYSDLCQYVS